MPICSPGMNTTAYYNSRRCWVVHRIGRKQRGGGMSYLILSLAGLALVAASHLTSP